ncbi:hypothetical protein WA026_004295 [Henosepilachna vigintioctopunctata]|uniref:5'-Nucleotidase C-terminal domain-containing protein n=1 Tax=Henosepilachna vigintioctopunctata TaxID=420089 RepID=A0AAW1V7N0_9CUCU
MKGYNETLEFHISDHLALKFTLSEAIITKSPSIQIVIDVRKPIGSRITSLKVRCAHREVPVYQEVKLDESYRIIVPSFLITGGDGFAIISKRMKNAEIGEVDVDAYMEYLKTKSPIFEEIDGRIEILGAETIESWDLFT